MPIQQLSRISTALLVTVFLISCSSVANPPASLVSNPPTVLMVVPHSNGDTNREIAVVFSESMDPASINASTFLIAGMTGAVSYEVTNKIAGFKPSPDFVVDTMYQDGVLLVVGG